MTERQTAGRIAQGARLAIAALVSLALAACGGGGLPTDSASTASTASIASASDTSLLTTGSSTYDIRTVKAPAVVTPQAASARASTQAATLLSASDAARLAQQASFGPTEALISDISTQGATAWIAAQMNADETVYPYLGASSVDTYDSSTAWCNAKLTGTALTNCFRDYFSVVPLGWQFYRHAITGTDQLRQRVAWALSQILVVNENEVHGLYGHRDYQQLFRDYAFGNYRDLLREVILSPVMGEFLNSVNNDKSDPNENFAREFLQLFTIGTCKLDNNGAISGGSCQPNYNNATVRNYAYALTGYTYPPGGKRSWCNPTCSGWQNPRFLRGQMVNVAAHHDQNSRALVNGVTVPAGASAAQALELVLDSVMNHQNIGPFVARRLIQALVTSNPSPAYVYVVGKAFTDGSYAGFGSGKRGDLAATVAAVLLNGEARKTDYLWNGGYGRLREPVQLYTAVMRATEANTDAVWFDWVYGDAMSQEPFNAPSVFNYYPPDYALAGTSYVSPAFGIENESSTLQRILFLWMVNNPWVTTSLRFDPSTTVSGAWGTYVSMSKWMSLTSDPASLVDRFALLATSSQLTSAQRSAMIDSVSAWNSTNDPTAWQLHRVRTAAYLAFLAPQFSVIR
ncbi:DUF1800 domain-containing protein [Derxia gummosa]|uniref:DUF1800 domain-containing protein n=1 Tax=Derxia gummosa DSM 723 TaxID=1121388 RepID=A0A8B6X3Z8_9BURK|nr:DUF1800 family protein [Derxia gummosa]